MAAATKADLEDRVSDLEDVIKEAASEMDQCDGSRIALQECVDSVREKLEEVYGESLTDDVREHLGIDDSDEDDEDEN